MGFKNMKKAPKYNSTDKRRKKDMIKKYGIHLEDCELDVRDIEDEVLITTGKVGEFVEDEMIILGGFVPDEIIPKDKKSKKG